MAGYLRQTQAQLCDNFPTKGRKIKSMLTRFTDKDEHETWAIYKSPGGRCDNVDCGKAYRPICTGDTKVGGNSTVGKHALKNKLQRIDMGGHATITQEQLQHS
ncbi:unnamed protein product [Allacma fusca]|uniref:Uncharacterized protein n=1 Tax=Allacma fusca TaxID=39272 RepID=A0A8J2LGG4_9HEXA|nr:unnamed protein product [Allacma fusca]